MTRKLNNLRKFLLTSLLVFSSIIMSINTSLAKDKLPKGISFIKTYGGISEYKLDNGLKILFKEDKKSPLFSWQVWYRVGSRNEKSGLTGLAHYLEHIMFKGTKTFDKGEIAQSIQLRGGVFNAFTGDDYTAYFETFSPENLELAIKLEADRMRNSRLDADEIDRERSVIISELEGGENNPSQIVYKTLKATAYQVHSYKNPIIGWADDLQNINADNMKEFYDTYYQPANATAVLVGNFDTKLALELIKKYFADHKANDKQLQAITKEPEQKGARHAQVQKEGFVQLLAMSFHIPEFSHEDYPGLNIIADVLFGGTSSRVYKKLIDTNKALDISGYAEAGIDPGIMRIIANLDPGQDIKEVEKIIDTELEAIKAGISDAELERARARVEASAVYERDGVYHQALQIGYFDNMGSWESYVDWVETINKVSNDDIKRIAKKYFTKANKTSVHLLPQEPSESLVETSLNSDGKEAIEKVTQKAVQAYGAATVEKLDPKKLKKLLKLTEPNSKIKEAKLDFDTHKINFDGIEIIYKEDSDPPLIYVHGILFAGSLKNPVGKPGWSYLVAEMLERGTKKHNKFEISDLLDLYGAEISFSSKKEVVEFEISTLSKYFDEVLDLFKEHINEPAFDAEELEKLKVETITAIKQENEYPSTIINREANRIVYPADHPYYSFTPEERIESISAASTEDIKDFYHSHYNANNLRLGIVGDIALDTVKAKLLPILKDWNKGAKAGKNQYRQVEFDDNNLPVIPAVKAVKAQEKIITLEEKKQVEVILAHAGELNRLNPDFYALLIANYALGGSPLSSRLGTIIRDEHGYVYDVRSGFNASIGAGTFYLRLGCNPKNVKDAIKLSKETIKDFIENGITETELEATKAYIGSSFAARNLSSNEDTAETLSHLLMYKLDDKYVENYAELIDSITIEDVNRVAKKYIKPDLFNVVIAGPKF